MKTSDPPTSGEINETSASLYRPALWVLYAFLISLYLILRFVLFGDRWPTQQDLPIEILWASVGTGMLIASSITLVMAQRTKGVQIALPWLLLTLSLGIGFAIFQAREYYHRWLHNLIPAPFANSLHDRADLYYLSAVQHRLMQIATAINADKVRQNQLIDQLQNPPEKSPVDRARQEAGLAGLQANEALRAERLAVINRLLISEVKWTSFVVATTEDLAVQRRAMAALAYDIYPHRRFAASHQQFRQIETQRLEDSLATANKGRLAAEASVKENSEPIKRLLSAVAETKAEQLELESQLKSHLRQQLMDEEQEDAPEEAGDPKRISLESHLAEVRKRLEERTAELSAAASLVTEAEDTASQLSQELRQITARQAITAEIDRSGDGLNRQYEWLRLPVCIPGGTVWAWSYFLLVSLHTTHLAVLILTVCAQALLPSPISGRWSNLNRIVPNWHSMVIVWILLYVLTYLL